MLGQHGVQGERRDAEGNTGQNHRRSAPQPSAPVHLQQQDHHNDEGGRGRKGRHGAHKDVRRGREHQHRLQPSACTNTTPGHADRTPKPSQGQACAHGVRADASTEQE
jgi:hypothetical protein